MNTTQQATCTCNTCPGASCACGCQQPPAQIASACGPQCQCGAQCQCAAQFRCDAGASCVQS